jgi:hypothetical protein
MKLLVILLLYFVKLIGSLKPFEKLTLNIVWLKKIKNMKLNNLKNSNYFNNQKGGYENNNK